MEGGKSVSSKEEAREDKGSSDEADRLADAVAAVKLAQCETPTKCEATAAPALEKETDEDDVSAKVTHLERNGEEQESDKEKAEDKDFVEEKTEEPSPDHVTDHSVVGDAAESGEVNESSVVAEQTRFQISQDVDCVRRPQNRRPLFGIEKMRIWNLEKDAGRFQLPPDGMFKIPRQWDLYTNSGEGVPRTPFLPFKAPLAPERIERNPGLLLHTPASLMANLNQRGIRLAVVVDLTLPLFYDPCDFMKEGIKYVKIPLDNREPNWKAVKVFLDLVRCYNQQEQKRLQLEMEKPLEERDPYRYAIGVHCTRGVNRTGYMICRALIELAGLPVDQAMADFALGRGYEMSEFGPELERVALGLHSRQNRLRH